MAKINYILDENSVSAHSLMRKFKESNLQHYHFTVETMNTWPQTRSGILWIPICKGAIRILIHPWAEFPQSQSCICTSQLEPKNKQTDSSNVQQLVLENLPSALRDQYPWISRLAIKTKKRSNRNPIGVHIPPISGRTQCSSVWYSKSPGFYV